MIGRTSEVRPFELLRWARQQARVCHLKQLEAHVLLVLATYANSDAIAWPSIKTLALDCGLRPTKDGRNSAISAALSRLEELRLVWTKQGGHGAPAKRELLFDPAQQPSVRTERSRRQPSATPEGSQPNRPQQPSALTDAQPSALTDQKYQGNGHLEQPNSNGQESLPATRKARHPAQRKGGIRRLGVLAALGMDDDITEATA